MTAINDEVATTGTDVTGLGLGAGTFDDAAAWLGQPRRSRSDTPVNDAMIRSYCALVEDPNPDYWDHGVAPPGMLMAWMMPLPWRPGGPSRRSGLFAFDVPLPGRHLINVSTDTDYLAPLRVGDILDATDELVDLSPLKHTRLGSGHFITTLTTFTVDGDDVARNTNVLFRYDTQTDPAAPDPEADTRLAAPTRPSLGIASEYGPPRRPETGDRLGPITLDVSLHRVVFNAAATGDWFPGHHNPFYARQQGQPTIYLSTLFFHGFIDRLATGWAGAGTTVRRRRIRMDRSILAGQTATAHGAVTEVRPVPDGWEADITATVDSPAGPCVPAELTIHIPTP